MVITIDPPIYRLTNQAGPCPLCGKTGPVDTTDYDSLHRSYLHWEIVGANMRLMHRNEAPEHAPSLHELHCLSTARGCGFSIFGSSAEPTIDIWNRMGSNRE